MAISSPKFSSFNRRRFQREESDRPRAVDFGEDRARLVIIIPSVNRVEQQRLFHGALDALSRFGELIGKQHMNS
jgi:hypothetical protein